MKKNRIKTESVPAHIQLQDITSPNDYNTSVDGYWSFVTGINQAIGGANKLASTRRSVFIDSILFGEHVLDTRFPASFKVTPVAPKGASSIVLPPETT